MHHDPLSLFAVLALIVAVLGAWTALDLFNRARSHLGSARLRWLGAAAVSLGLGIWSMHFIAMLGFRPDGGVAYDGGLTLLSFLLAAFGTGGAFLTAAGPNTRPVRLSMAALLMGAGVWLHLTERHEHLHTHEPLTHAHRHAHDEHHQHPHDFDWDGREPHTHEHTHAPITHAHPHYPDIHHRHPHR